MGLSQCNLDGDCG